MTVAQAIANAQALTGQVFPQEALLRWLSELDGQLAFGSVSHRRLDALLVINSLSGDEQLIYGDMVTLPLKWELE